jgi:hypothetical protein
VLKVGPFGRVRPVAIFPNEPDAAGFQAVPTGVVRGPDGALYVSQLTGFPFPVGGAKIFRLDPRGGPPTEYASGITNGMDLAFGRDGTLYVLEIDADSLFPVVGPKTDGAIMTVPWHRSGSVEAKPVALPEGTLTEPGGLAIGKRGELYVSNHAREAGAGEVLRIDLG